jgi:hypothetical protein
MIRSGAMFGADGRLRHDAILVDIDHAPRKVLHASHADFYTEEGHQRLFARLEPGGVFSLWSDDPPDVDYLAVLEGGSASAEARVVTFPNPLTGGEGSATLYLAHRSEAS